MASLTLTVGSLTATLNATDANATRVLNAFLRHEVPVDELSGMTTQQKLSRVLQLTVQKWVAMATVTERREAEAAAQPTDKPIFV